MPRPSTGPKCPVQFRLGAALLAEIDEAVLSSDHNSRNLWMSGAIRFLLERDSIPKPHLITPEHLFHDRQLVTLKIDEILVELMNEACDQSGMTRSLWLLNAATSYLTFQYGKYGKD